jgi:deoxyuridine 5'-triphosphate nucleotidohydrolase
MELLIKLLTDNAIPPMRCSLLAAGYDLCSNENTVVPARGRKLVHTGIAITIPEGHYGRIAPRSGLALKKGIDVGAGVCDADYRGEICVILFNHSDEDFEINEGDRIAQLILEWISTPPIRVVDDLDDTERGENGFGSSGI